MARAAFQGSSQKLIMNYEVFIFFKPVMSFAILKTSNQGDTLLPCLLCHKILILNQVQVNSHYMNNLSLLK